MAQPKKTTKKYDDQVISALKGADRVRLRPAVIFGSDGLDGCEHSFFEILSNSVDEAKEGYGDEIFVTVRRDHVLEVEDFGRGVPLGYNEREQRYNWELIYCELYAGGKYNNNDGGAYEFALGLNGLGACATQYSSEFMDVYSYNGETLSEMHFKKGNPVGELKVRPLERKERRTGTITRWKPDLEVFNDIDIPEEHFLEVLRHQAVCNSGTRFHLRFEQEDGTFSEAEFFYADGISDYLLEVVSDNMQTKPVLWSFETKGRDRPDRPEYRLKADVTLCFATGTPLIELYHNSSPLENTGGSTADAIRNAIPAVINSHLERRAAEKSKAKPVKAKGKAKDKDKEKEKAKAKENKIIFDDVKGSLAIVINSFSTQTSYANQTKKSINNPFIRSALTAFLKEKLDRYLTESPREAETIFRQVLQNKKAREAQKRIAEDIITEITNTNQDKDPLSRVEKFVNCRSKDRNVRELYIVEGDSALTSCKLGRAAEFQAIIPVRGKTLNCLKSSYERIFKNDIIKDLLKVIGCGVEILENGKRNEKSFSLDTLTWSKIIICTDADEDGFQIRTLLLTIFYRLLPTLLSEGRIYIAESPLYEITAGKDVYFAYNEPEKAEILKSLGDKKYTVQRSKGLGENEPDMMWRTTMCPATRRLICVTPDDAQKTAWIFETLLGDDLESRKAFIAANGARYLSEADI